MCGVPGAGRDGKKAKGKEKEDKNGETTPHKVVGGVDGNMVGYYHLSLLTLYKNRKLKISLAIFLQCVVFGLEAQ